MNNFLSIKSNKYIYIYYKKMAVKMEHVLILLIAVFLLYHFVGRCRCNGFSVGSEQRIKHSKRGQESANDSTLFLYSYFIHGFELCPVNASLYHIDLVSMSRADDDGGRRAVEAALQPKCNEPSIVALLRTLDEQVEPTFGVLCRLVRGGAPHDVLPKAHGVFEHQCDTDLGLAGAGTALYNRARHIRLQHVLCDFGLCCV